jgi:hypothetical protein
MDVRGQLHAMSALTWGHDSYRTTEYNTNNPTEVLNEKMRVEGKEKVM